MASIAAASPQRDWERERAGQRRWERLSHVILVVSLAWFIIFGIGAQILVEVIDDAAFWIVGVALQLSALVAIIVFAPMKRRFKQKQRDSIAQQIFTALKAGGPSPYPYVLYLRPFASTNLVVGQANLGQRAAASQLGVLGLVLRVARNELELRLWQGSESLGPVIALGKPGEHYGAGRIPTSDDDWRTDIALLIRHARLIFFLPSESEGASWEFQHLLDTGAMPKTLVIDPPNRFWKKKKYDHSREWDQVRETFAAQGYQLPEDDKKGLFLHFLAPGEPTVAEPLEFKQLEKLRAQIAAAAERSVA